MKIGGNTDIYSQISSGKRINSASDDPAGLAISQKLEGQIRGDSQSIKNIESSQDLLKTAGGSLQNIQSDLSRIRELSVQASNGINSAGDKKVIQSEISNLLSNIQDSVQNTEFNGIKLIDGSFSDKTLGAGANGQGSKMTIQNTGLESLGIDGFSVEGDFNIDDIDQAINKVSESLGEIGASTNALQNNLKRTRVSEVNQTASKSTIADLDIAKAMTELNKKKSLDQYKILLQQKQTENEQDKLGLLL